MSNASVAELLARPESFDRNIVTVRGRVQTGFQDSFLLDAGRDGELRVWLDWADDLPEHGWTEFAVVSSGREGHAFLTGERSNFPWRRWLPRPAVELRRDDAFTELNRYLSARSPQILFSRARAFYEVEATVTGRFDHLPGTIILRNEEGERGLQPGFGPAHRLRDRIVVGSVADVRATPIAGE